MATKNKEFFFHNEIESQFHYPKPARACQVSRARLRAGGHLPTGRTKKFLLKGISFAGGSTGKEND
jgi:hypothetical protein